MRLKYKQWIALQFILNENKVLLSSECNLTLGKAATRLVIGNMHKTLLIQWLLTVVVYTNFINFINFINKMYLLKY